MKSSKEKNWFVEFFDENELACYIHIPFCKKKCNYCAFYSITKNFDEKEYLSALKKEIDLLKKKDIFYGKKIKTFYIGGGTPSLLSVSFLENLLTELQKIPQFSPEEITIEANPESLTFQKLKAYKSLGFNRISLGVQTFSERGLIFLGRIHSAKEALRAIENIKLAEFSNFSVDLIYDWKGQTLKDLEKDLSILLNFNPPHLSFYELEVEEGTPLFVKFRGKPWSSEEKVKNFFLFIHQFLTSYEFKHYEISNYAREGFECLHNRFYWEVKPYLGLGAGAVSRLHKNRFKNPNYNTYVSLLKKDQNPREIIEILNPEKLAKEYIFMKLRTSEGISQKFLKNLGFSFEKDRISLLEKSGLIRFNKEKIALTPEGMLLLNQVILFLWENLKSVK